MAPVRLALCVALLLLLTRMTAAAADVRQGGTIVVPADVTLEDDLYAFGDTISILGTVRGDVVAFGMNVNVDGTVTGDLITAGQSVTVRGQVGGSVRAAGQTVVIDGKIAGDLVVAGNDVTILLNGRVGRDVYVAGATFTQTGEIARDLRAGTNTTTIDGHVGRRAQIDADTLRLTPRALVDGPLQYTSAKEASIAQGATVRGQVERHEAAQATPAAAGPAALVINWLRGGLGLLVLGLILVFFFPGFSRRAGEALVRAPLRSLLVGVGVLIGLPLLAVLMFVAGAFVGTWWLGLALLAFYLAAFAVSLPVSALGVGASILRVTRRPALPALALIVGLIVLLVVGLVPILGSVFLAVAALLGLGATSTAVAGGRRQEQAEHQPVTV